MRLDRIVTALAVCCFGAMASAAEEVESFDGGGFTNPFFEHEFEFNDGASWKFVEHSPGDWALHLCPNVDTITFQLAAGEAITSIRILIQDFEGGFVGDSPTSVATVRSSHGDFIPMVATRLGVWTELSATIFSPGNIAGAPLGDIVEVQLQAANQGNSEVPGIGALFDDIIVTTAPSLWTDLGMGTSGTNGVPVLSGIGGPIADSPVTVRLDSALPNGTATLILGLSRVDLPFLGGTLVPSPDFFVLGLPIGPGGDLSLSATWPTGLPADLKVFFQMWIPDPSGPSGFAASNGLCAKNTEEE